MADQRTSIILKSFDAAVKYEHEYIKYAIDPEDINIIIVMLHHLESPNNEYIDGEYLIKFKLPPEYPAKPPHFTVLTPNGVYDVDAVGICIDMGHYHSSNYPTNIGFGGFAMQIVYGLMDPETIKSGIGIHPGKVEERKKLAKLSTVYNLEYHKKYVDLINSTYDSYSKKWEKQKQELTTPVDIIAARANARGAARAARAKKDELPDVASLTIE